MPQEKTKFFTKTLRDFFKKAGREHLPWRKQGITAYEVWVSEVMLQQTQVTRVIGYYSKFLKRFPTVRHLARAKWEQFLPFYQGLGYYSRGRNMLRTAKVVVEEYGGRFPQDKAVLVKLPGIGEYTAAAILSFAYGDNHLAWDTNLKRVIGRFFLGTRHVTAADQATLEQSLLTLGPAKEWNAGLMDFGSALCTARPKCGNCPLAPQCAYFKSGGRGEGKRGKGKKEGGKRQLVSRTAAALIYLHEGHREYFSASEKLFKPFLLPATHNTRVGIKAWFRERYGLELAVRPPHRVSTYRKKPVLLVNAQILLGRPAFATFEKKAVLAYNQANSLE